MKFLARLSSCLLAFAALSYAHAQTTATTPSCKAFVGKWEGSWQRNSQGSQGKRWLHVSEVSDQCVAKWAFLDEDREPRGWATATIVDDTLTLQGRTGIVTTYKLKGSELWAEYRSPSGNSTNQAVFTRVAPAPK